MADLNPAEPPESLPPSARPAGQAGESALQKAMQALDGLIAQLQEAPLTVSEDKDAVIFADESELSQLQGQLNALLAQADAMDRAANNLLDGDESGDAQDAKDQAATMRAEVQGAQEKINTARNSKDKKIPAAQVKALIGRIIAAANHETVELGQAVTEARTHDTEARAHLSEKKAPSPAAAVSPRRVAPLATQEPEEKGGNPAVTAHKPLLDPKDSRNHDGHVGVREATLGAASLIQAVTSKKKRETYARIVHQMSDAVADDDRRGMLDSALHAGRGVARVTGSDDVGHMATIVIGVGITKTHTTGKLLSDGDGLGILSAIGRNLDSAFSHASDAVGMNDFADNLRPLLGQLMADTQMDWENLANKQRVRQFDVDGNGRLDAQEVISVFRNNNVTFEVVDANADDTLSYEEVTAQLKKIALKNNAYSEDRVNSAIFARGAGRSPSLAYSH